MYRIRIVDREEMAYIGQTGRNLNERIRGLGLARRRTKRSSTTGWLLNACWTRAALVGQERQFLSLDAARNQVVKFTTYIRKM